MLIWKDQNWAGGERKYTKGWRVSCITFIFPFPLLYGNAVSAMSEATSLCVCGVNATVSIPSHHTLNSPLEEGFTRLTGSHAVVVPRSNVPTHQAQPLGDGVEHVLALGGWVLHDGAGAVVVALAAGPAADARAVEHGRRVQAVGVAAHGHAVAPAGVGGATGAVVADGVNAGGWAGRLGLDEGPTAGGEVPLLRGHSAEQPAGREQRHSATAWPNPLPGLVKREPSFHLSPTPAGSGSSTPYRFFLRNIGTID